MIYSNKVIYTFKWVLSQTNIIKCLSYYWFYQKHCPHIFLLTIKRAYLLCNWSGNIFKESKKLRQYIWFDSTIVFWSNQIQEFNSSHIIILCVCVCVTGHRSVEYVQIMRWWSSNLGQWPLQNLGSVDMLITYYRPYLTTCLNCLWIVLVHSSNLPTPYQ